MARRLTTNQEIAGSIPASLKMVDFFAFLSGGKSFLSFFLSFYFLVTNFLRPAKTALASLITETNGKRSSCIAK
jgi:hypothetical protein